MSFSTSGNSIVSLSLISVYCASLCPWRLPPLPPVAAHSAQLLRRSACGTTFQLQHDSLLLGQLFHPSNGKRVLGRRLDSLAPLPTTPKLQSATLQFYIGHEAHASFASSSTVPIDEFMLGQPCEQCYSCL